LNEVFINDEKKLHLFNFLEKIFDYFYRIAIEDMVYFPLLSSITFELSRRSEYASFSGYLVFASCLIFLVGSFSVIREKFSVKSIDDMYAKLSKRYWKNDRSSAMRAKYRMLCEIEDASFYERRAGFYNLVSFSIIKRGLRHLKPKVFMKPIRYSRHFLTRGHSTIEMQLIRTIGVNTGYERCLVRRKIFEMVFSSLLFNCLRREFACGKYDNLQFRDWIIENYLYNASIKLGEFYYFPSKDASTCEQLFAKDYDKISDEQFLIWCSGLQYYNDVGPRVLKTLYSVTNAFGLDKKRIAASYKTINKRYADYEWDIFLSD